MRVREATSSELAGSPAWRASARGREGRKAERWTSPRYAPGQPSARAPQARTEPQVSAVLASVLVVEDDRVSRRILTALLKQNGYATESAASAEDALQALESHPLPRIALVDLDLPGMNGMELIDRLRELDPTTIPVLVTATDEESLATALHGRPVVYVRKPVDFNRLLGVLRDLQGRKGPEAWSTNRDPGDADRGRDRDRLLH
jgi:CheY-like chemotaxis protein